MTDFPSQQVEPQSEYSLPYPLHHKSLDKTPLPEMATKPKETDYQPADEGSTTSEVTFTSTESSFSRDSYDPLSDLNGYLKMRDQL